MAQVLHRTHRAGRSTLRQLIDLHLAAAGRPSLDAIINAARAGSPPVTWYLLADQVTEQAGVSVSWETLRSWYPTAT